ncbi:MAG TPA: hypothetical protein DEG88_02985 [Propionibacteriaceae bacterium]|nr:hypothetical protein [Propionibacteriaceae bacterium]
MIAYADIPMEADLPALVRVMGLRVRMDETRPPTHRAATILDTPDARLLSWGITLSHQISHGVSNWRLQAPTWEPWLPADAAESASDGEVPMRFADMIRPFRRSGLLGPLADVTTSSEYLVGEAPDGHRPLLISDHEVVARQGGPKPIEFRSLTVTFDDVALADDLVAAVEEARGTVSAQSRSLGSRLGRRSHIESRTLFNEALPMPAFVVALTELRWRELLQAHVSSRGSKDDQAVAAVLTRLRGDVTGLAAHLLPAWVERVLSLLDGALAARPPLYTSGKYYLVLDDLELTTQNPIAVVVPNEQGCGSVLRQEIERLVHEAADASRVLTDRSPDTQWMTAAHATAGAASLLEATGPLFGEESRQARKALGRVLAAQWACVAPDEVSRREIAQLGSAEAFERGRTYERAVQLMAGQRALYLEDARGLWRKVMKRQVRP